MKKLFTIVLFFAVAVGSFAVSGAGPAMAEGVCMCRPQSGCTYNYPNAAHGTWGNIVQGLSDEDVKNLYQIATSYNYLSYGTGYDGQTGWYCMRRESSGSCACVNSLQGCPVVYPNGVAGTYLQVVRGLSDATVKASYVYNRSSSYDGGAAYDPTSGWFCVK